MELTEILRATLQSEASDLHLKVGAPPMVRVDGALVPMEHSVLTRQDLDRIVDELLDERQRDELAAERELDCSASIRGLGRFRVNAALQRGTPTLTLRAIPIETPGIETLNLPPVVGRLALRTRGLILVTGVTGSGKTTTLASMIGHINANRRVKIVTIEDPIEFLFRDNKAFVAQREVGSDTLSFHAGLRHVLRQDPDVLMIGEIRDTETMDTALKAANTGHLVFATLHTTNAIQTIQRILTFFPPRQHAEVRGLVAENLAGVISLRLIPRADGNGRIPACEVMVGTEAIREFLQSSGELGQIAELIAEGGVQYGMQTFDQSLMELYQSRKISQDEALANATNAAEFELRLRGIESVSDRWDRT